MKFTFLSFHKKLLLEQTFQVQLDMLYMLFLRFRKDEYVINVDKEEFVQYVPEYIIDH